ncbi:MAG TPA: MFS transporter, partial [Pseudolysinimonas sp.]
SSALSIADSTGSAIALATTAIAFSALGGAASPTAFAGVFAVNGVLCLAAWMCGGRIVRR